MASSPVVVPSKSFKYGAHCKHSNKPVRSGAEASFVHRATQAGYEVIKRGWPDFLITKGDKVFAVEVKRCGEPLTPAQKEVMAILRKLGVKCKVYRTGPSRGFYEE